MKTSNNNPGRKQTELKSAEMLRDENTCCACMKTLENQKMLVECGCYL